MLDFNDNNTLLGGGVAVGAHDPAVLRMSQLCTAAGVVACCGGFIFIWHPHLHE